MTIPTIPKLDSLDLIPDTGFYQVAGKYLVQAAGRPNEFTQAWQAVIQGYGMYVFHNLEPIGLAVIAGGRRYWAPITCEDPRAPARGDLVEVSGLGPFLPPEPEEDEERGPIVVNPKVSGNLAIGDYVFASRWSDCDPGDPWGVGFITAVGDKYVQLGDVTGMRCYPYAMRITEEQGARILKEYPAMESLPLPYVAIAKVFGVPIPPGWTDAVEGEQQ